MYDAGELRQTTQPNPKSKKRTKMKNRILSMFLAAMMLLSLAACGGSQQSETTQTDTAAVESTAETTTKETAAEEPAEASAAGSADVYEQMKQVYTKAGAGKDEDGFFYFLAYDENVDNAIFVLLDPSGSASMNVVGPVAQEDSWLIIQDQSNDTAFRFGLTDISDEGFVMMLKNGSQVSMSFTDAPRVIALIKSIDEGTEIINPLA